MIDRPSRELVCDRSLEGRLPLFSPEGKNTVVKIAINANDEEIFAATPKRPSPLPSMPRHFVEAFPKEVCPSDADFILGENNQVRWIDPFAWTRRRWKSTSSDNPDRGKNGNAFTHFMYFFSKHTPTAAKSFLDQFLRELKSSPNLTSSEKTLLLEDLFLSQHQRDPATQRRLRDYFKAIGMTSSDQTEPLSVIFQEYESIR